MKLRVAVRGFANGKRIFEDRIEVDEDEQEGIVGALAIKHAGVMAMYPAHMIEIEFLDEPDPEARFFRVGTDPRAMVMPAAFSLGVKRVD